MGARKKTNLILIGMPGTFKTSAGGILANRLDMFFMDTDDFFRFEYATTIPKIFEEYGEDFFRELESKIVRRVSQYQNCVISTGGGTVLREENMRNLLAGGWAVWLTATAKEIARRLEGDAARPLLAGGKLKNIRALAAERDALYREYADITVDNTGMTPEETAEAVEKELLRFFGALDG